MTIQLDPLIIFIFYVESSAALFSLLINIYLILLVVARGFRFGNYRYFIYAFALLDCLYSMGSSISMYQNHADEEMVLVFSLAPWRENKRIFKVSLNLFFFSYIGILVHITMSSLYRYALLCNKNLRRMFEKRLRIMLGIIFLFCFSAYYLDALSEILTEEVLLSKDIVSVVLEPTIMYIFHIQTIHKMYNADLTRIGVVGNTIENVSKQPLSGKTGLIVVLGIGFMIISASCGYAIHLTLQGTAISQKTKEAHSKALKLLLAQFALPVIFLHIPTFTFEFYSLLIQDKIPMFVRIYIRIFLTYYPVANAACIMSVYFFTYLFLTDDFRNYILSLSGGEWKVVTVVTPLPFIVSPVPSVWIRGFRFGNYRYFIYVFAILDCIYSIGNFLSMNIPHSDGNVFIIFSLAPWRESRYVFIASLNVFFFSYILILVHVTLASLYRYALLCNETLRKIFESKFKLTFLFAFASCFVLAWLQTLNDLLDDDLMISEDAINTVQREYKVDLIRVPVIGNALQNVTKQPLLAKVLFILFVGVLFNSISGLCSYLIHATLESRAISSKAKRAHLKALRLLLVQFALPFFFLYLPTIVIEFFALFLQTNIPLFCKIYILLLFSFYPVASAACVLFLTDDFRLFILSSGKCLVVNVVVIPPPIINSIDYSPDRNTTRSL